MTLTTLVTGASGPAREAAIAAQLDTRQSTALILEGLPDGEDRFACFSSLQISRIAPGCMCCTGNLTLRVTLNRILRHPPERLFISLATATHLDELRLFLTSTPYDKYLQFTEDLQV